MWWDEETEFYISLIKLGLKMIEGCYSCCLLKGNIHRQLKVKSLFSKQGKHPKERWN